MTNKTIVATVLCFLNTIAWDEDTEEVAQRYLGHFFIMIDGWKDFV